MTNLKPERVRRVAAACILVLSAAGLTACGSSNDRDNTTPPPVGSPPPSTVDAFFAFVEARVSALLDNDEPIDIDAVPVTTQDTTEPETLK